MALEPLCHLPGCAQGTQRGLHCFFSLSSGAGRSPSQPCPSSKPEEQCHRVSGNTQREVLGPGKVRQKGKSHQEQHPPEPQQTTLNLSASPACSERPLGVQDPGFCTLTWVAPLPLKSSLVPDAVSNLCSAPVLSVCRVLGCPAHWYANTVWRLAGSAHVYGFTCPKPCGHSCCSTSCGLQL